MLLKQSLERLRKSFKKIEITYLNCSLYLHLLIKQNLLISSEKMVMSGEIKGCATWFRYFLGLLWVRYNCVRFHHCRICVTYFKERGPFCSPHPWAFPKTPILNRVKVKDGNKDKNNKLMSFRINDEKLLQKYKTICHEIEDLKNTEKYFTRLWQ